MPFDLTDPEQLALRAPAYALAFAEAGHALGAQEQMMRDLIARAGMLMAASAVSTSIFGGQLLTDGHRHPAAWVAVAAFAGVSLAVIDVLWPRHGWELETPANNILTTYVEPAVAPMALIHRDLAIHQLASVRRNRARLRRASRSLQLGMIMLPVEVLAGVASVIGLA
jgi:hypothetical protein